MGRDESESGLSTYIPDIENLYRRAESMEFWVDWLQRFTPLRNELAEGRRDDLVSRIKQNRDEFLLAGEHLDIPSPDASYISSLTGHIRDLLGRLDLISLFDHGNLVEDGRKLGSILQDVDGLFQVCAPAASTECIDTNLCEARVHMRYLISRDLPDILAARVTEPPTNLSNEELQTILREKNGIGWVAEADGNVIGHVIYQFFHTRIRLREIGVVRGHRSHGVGSRLLQFIVKNKITDTFRHNRLVLDVPLDNPRTNLFLRRNGGRNAGLLDETVLWHFPRPNLRPVNVSAPPLDRQKTRSSGKKFLKPNRKDFLRPTEWNPDDTSTWSPDDLKKNRWELWGSDENDNE